MQVVFLSPERYKTIKTSAARALKDTYFSINRKFTSHALDFCVHIFVINQVKFWSTAIKKDFFVINTLKHLLQKRMQSFDNLHIVFRC